MIKRIILVILAALYKLIAKLHPLLKPEVNLAECAKMPSNSPKSREISDARRLWQKRWAKANPDKIRAYVARFFSRHPNYTREYYLANIDRIKEYKKIYGIFNRAKINESQRKWRKANPDKVKAQNKRVNPDKAKARTIRFLNSHPNYKREYYAEHKERLSAYLREWRRKRREAQVGK